MSLAEKIKTLQPSSSGLPCGVARVIRTMDKDDIDSLNDVLFPSPGSSKMRIPNSKIHELLVEEGYDISLATIAHHRRRQCRCFSTLWSETKDGTRV